MPDRGRVFSLAGCDGIVQGHLARGRKLHGRGHIDLPFFEYRAISFQDGRKTDLRMTVSGGDGGLLTLRPGEKLLVYLFGKEADVFPIGGRKRIGV